MPDAAREIISENLTVRIYDRDPARIIVVFNSAGARRRDGFAEEYHATLADFGVSIAFVTDTHVRWYNYPDTQRVFTELAAIVAGYAHVGVMGESLGGSGAILFTRFARVSRVLAITPQFSVAPPFVRFDGRYGHIGEKIGAFYYVDFAATPVPEKCVMLYGNTVWRDYIHMAMFAAAGWAPMFVDGAPHEVSAFLKSGLGHNALAILLARFCDFDAPFTPEALWDMPGIPWSREALRPEARFGSEQQAVVEFNRRVAEPMTLPPAAHALLSAGKRATQSSLSAYSLGKTLEEDASGALDGRITGNCRFHTDIEDQPWWRVDLAQPCRIAEIRIFNRMGHFNLAQRGFRFEILVSADRHHWERIAVKDDDLPFGGSDGRPYILTPAASVHGRYVMIRLLGRNFLHLAQVQVFGLLAVGTA